MKRIGFTLSEVMIVLVVIGVITGILLPTAIQSTPDKNVMKFKKGYNTLGQVIRELVTSDKYYKDGDLGIRANGELIDGNNEGDVTYLCETFADVANVKYKKCSTTNPNLSAGSLLSNDKSLEVEKQWLDTICKIASKRIGSEIILQDDIHIFQTSPIETFGMDLHGANLNYCATLTDEILPDYCINSDWGHGERNYGSRFNSIGMDIAYKALCIDIDGFPDSSTENDCINECPFGFGIRADGKILPGARADEWLNKSIQKENE